ncbi:hypothetical protein BDV59DRAFT_169016 [Aspergillus ambiguus]|uniref:SH3 domain protein n=1 Tax=Aspergillus ambiguus TaxID=176160 RepID=UPI003CCD180A
MATTNRGPGLGDLEKELTCSICTELLYQPLTLLDCLHTYCGSCLKEWFSAQASRRRSPSSTRFTCPSCRAVVRETRPNATVTTLLDMVLAANPERNKSAAEKEEIAQRYKHGDSVFPTVSSTDSSPRRTETEDLRLSDGVRDLSLQESGARASDTGGRRIRRSSRTRRAESVDGRSRRRREDERASRRQVQRGARGEESSERTRRIEHQSSLRSLLSLSDTETMEEEILRQILEEGLLDDIDIDNLGPVQEEELSERIADAYRRRHRLRSRSQQRRETQDAPLHDSNRPRSRSQSTQRPQPAPVSQDSSRNPPVFRPYLLDPLLPPAGQSGHQRRLSDQGSSRRRTSPIPVHPASTSDVGIGQATRSSSDMIADRPRPSHVSRAHASGSRTPRLRRATETGPPVSSISTSISTAGDQHLRSSRPSVDSPTTVSSTIQSLQNGTSLARSGQVVPSSSTTSSLAAEVGRHSRPSSSRTKISRSSYPEPSVLCDRCGKQNIQYEIHKKCPQCNNGNYHICLRCYRLGLGCLNWIGFEQSAKAVYERIQAVSNGQPLLSQEPKHILLSVRYSRPPASSYMPGVNGRETTNEDPTNRLQTGLFCDICLSLANDCLWKCNQCNEGDWGFCNRCVNQGRCCTHPLLPVCRITPVVDSNGSTPPQTNEPIGSGSETKILSFSTKCDICTDIISSSTLRFHCLQCNDGDYDICANCYLKLVATSKIRKENGHNGWRRCLKGHRMVVVGFEGHGEGQRRVIVRDLVGGRALKDEHLHSSTSASSSPATPSTPRLHGAGRGTVASPESGLGDWSWKEGSERRKKASRVRNPALNERDRNGNHSEPSTPVSANPLSMRRYPPDGGVGLIVHALWSYYPESEVTDELMFPRGAEITEAENINDDWYWGCYAGFTGLFPGGHVFVVGEVV